MFILDGFALDLRVIILHFVMGVDLKRGCVIPPPQKLLVHGINYSPVGRKSKRL